MLRDRMAIKGILSVLTGAALLFGGTTLQAKPPAKDDAGAAQGRSGPEITIPVTVETKGAASMSTGMALKADEFSVREADRPQTILSVKSATEAPPIIEVLIQDDLTSRLDNEIKGIKGFINNLPEGSRVLTGYITAGSLNVTQNFTTDLHRAADSLRILRGPAVGSPYNPYVELIEGLHRFDSQPAGRRVVLFISDGLDTSHGFFDADPAVSIDLNRAIRDAQARQVAVFSFFAPGVHTRRVSMATNFGQGSLLRLTQDTGGESMFEGTTLVTFSPFLRELQTLLGNQYLITYRSTNVGPGFRPISVTTESGLKLLYPKGYWTK